MSLRVPDDTHLAMSSWIAQAGLCGWKFRLGLIFGVPGRGNRGSAAGFFVHDVLSRSSEAIESVWRSGGTQTEIANRLSQQIESIKAPMLPEWKSELEERYESLDFDSVRVAAETRLGGIVEGLAQYLGTRPPPLRILTELPITNVETRHEGRLDAIFEWDEHFTTVDFKTYSDDMPRSHGYDHLQIVANGMLANHRYGHAEADFSNNELVVIYTGGIYLPRPTQRIVERVLDARNYVLECLRAGPSHTQTLTGNACYVCPMVDACGFYKTTERLHKAGQLTQIQEELRTGMWHRRYAVLDFRQISHKNKFIAGLNELALLEQFRILESGYTIRRTPQGGSLLLTRAGGSKSFLEGDPVKVIGLEDGIPLLACINFNGAIEGVNQDGIEVALRQQSASNAHRLLRELPIAVMRTEIDLTRRELQALDYVQRRAPPQVRELAMALLGDV